MFRKIIYSTIFAIFCIIQLNAQKRVIIPPTEDYIKHLNAAKSHNLGLINTKSDLNKHIDRGNLVKVKQRGYGWRTADLTHSHAYLVPKANQTLRDIAREFVKTTGQNFFVVTSLTRTLKDQDRLRGVNSNASSNDSSHSYGASFDISYVRFNHRLVHDENLDKALNQILKSFEKSGKIYFVKERLSRCYHVVVR
jgi:hypothetical protein